MDYQIDHDPIERGHLVVASGELDISATPRLSTVLAMASASPGGRLVLDLSEVAFIDSTALGTILKAAAQLDEAGTSLAVVAPGGPGAPAARDDQPHPAVPAVRDSRRRAVGGRRARVSTRRSRELASASKPHSIHAASQRRDLAPQRQLLERVPLELLHVGRPHAEPARGLADRHRLAVAVEPEAQLDDLALALGQRLTTARTVSSRSETSTSSSGGGPLAGQQVAERACRRRRRPGGRGS